MSGLNTSVLGPNPLLPVPVYGTEGVGDAVREPLRRPLVSSDPDVLALYERLVIAREGVRAFMKAAIEEGAAEWVMAGEQIEYLINRAQERAEELR